MWKEWNNGKLVNKFIMYRCSNIQYSLQEDASFNTLNDTEQIKNSIHRLNLYVQQMVFNTEQRRDKYRNGIYKGHSDGIANGYIVTVDIKRKKLLQVNLSIEPYGWEQTESILNNRSNNKEEIEFIKRMLKGVDII